MRIAVDAMGGDFAPREIVAGTLEAARTIPGITKLYLVGDENAIRREFPPGQPVPRHHRDPARIRSCRHGRVAGRRDPEEERLLHQPRRGAGEERRGPTR